MSPRPYDQLAERSHVSMTAVQCSGDAEIKSQLTTEGVTRSPIELFWIAKNFVPLVMSSEL